MSQMQAATRRAGLAEQVPSGSFEKLVWLTRFGKPRVGVYGNSERAEWHAHIEMHVAAKGATFEVRSDYDCNTPDVAVDQLIDRLLDTLARFNGGQE